jgi:uncharacterized protein
MEGSIMRHMTEAVLLRIFVGNDDTYEDRPLYEAIIEAARDAQLAGATVSRAIAGYGKSALVHEILRGFSRDVPVVVEIVDHSGKVETWLEGAAALLGNALVTVQDIRVLEFPSTRPGAPAGRR